MALRGPQIKAALSRILAKSLLIVEGETKKEAPVDTGRLRSSITDGKELFATFARIGPTVSYAKFVEYGTRFMKANPFMKRGAENSLPKIEEVIHNEIKKAIS